MSRQRTPAQCPVSRPLVRVLLGSPPVDSLPSPPSSVLPLDPPPCRSTSDSGLPLPPAPTANHPMDATGLPGFQRVPCLRDVALDPGRARRRLAMTAPHVWPSTNDTVSASAMAKIPWLNPTPRTLAVYASAAPLPVATATLATRRFATPYLGGTFPRWITLASAQRTPSFLRIVARRNMPRPMTRKSNPENSLGLHYADSGRSSVTSIR